MSKVFRDSESLGKSAGKKWSQNWTFLLGSGLKSSRKKKFFFADFLSTWFQNWVHQHNNICVGSLNFDHWCTLNLISSLPGLSLVKAPGVKIGCINTIFLVLEHSILTLGALLTYYLADTSHVITSQASHCIGATNCIGREIRCIPYAGFFCVCFGMWMFCPCYYIYLFSFYIYFL